MLYSPMINTALRIMFEAHKTQTDKNGIPYVFHPFHIAEQMEDEDSTIVALLHDTIEDAGLTPEYLLEQGFSQKIVDSVVTLTKKDNENYFDYIRRVELDPLAKTVKLADLKHNCDVSRLESVSAIDVQRTKKYREAIAILTNT